MWLLLWYYLGDERGIANPSFRVAELYALAKSCGVDARQLLFANRCESEGGRAALARSPPWVSELLASCAVEPSLMPVRFDMDLAMALRICQRSVLIHAVLEVWGTGRTLALCAASITATRARVAAAARTGLPDLLCAASVATRGPGGHHIGASGCENESDGTANAATPSAAPEVATQSFRIRTSGIGCSPSRRAERAACATLLPLCGLRGCVRMQGAACVLHYIHDCRAYCRDPSHPSGSRRAGAGAGAREGSGGRGDVPHNDGDSYNASACDAPADGGSGGGSGGHADGDGMLVFARELSRGSRNLLDRLALAKRRYLGATTMPPDSALLAANLAAVSRGDIVLDPCCGSGGLLVACAVFGAVVLGADANSAVVSGAVNPRRNKGHSPDSNFEQYGVSSNASLGWCVADLTNHPLRKRPVFDAIVCDPPYGYRETGRAITTTTAASSAEVPASSAACGLGAVFDGLLDLAADVLRDGGRLVFWRPVAACAAQREEEAAHEATKVASSCMVETFRCELMLARRMRGHGKQGKGRGRAPAAQGSTDYSRDREAGRERRTLIVLEKSARRQQHHD